MKQALLLTLLAFSINAQAQFTLEAVYDSAATWNTPASKGSQLIYLRLEFSGERYIKVSKAAHKILVYNLDHSLEKSISLAGFPLDYYGQVEDILYLSEGLFNTDEYLEFMYVHMFTDSSGEGNFETRIYNERGTVLFADTSAPWIKGNYHQQQYPIYNTSAGTKMILSTNKGQARVFGLEGTLTPSQQLVNELIISQAYPNPAMYSTRIDYSFPKGITEGILVFYDLNGIEVKRFTVDDTFDHLLVSTQDLGAGTYYYQLQTSAKISDGKKLVVVR